MRQGIRGMMILVIAGWLVACGKEGKTDPSELGVFGTEDVDGLEKSEREQTVAEDGAPAAEMTGNAPRGNYRVDIPANWEAKEEKNGLVATKDGIKLTLRDCGLTEVAICAKHDGCTIDNRLEEQIIGGNTWTVYRKAAGFSFVYYTAFPDGHVVRVGATATKADDPEVIRFLEGIKW